MTQKEFDNYNFSIKTEINFRGEWYKITEVNFGIRFIGIENGYYLNFKDSDITGIRN